MNTVWIISSKTFSIIFATKEDADKWLMASGMNTPASRIEPVEFPVISFQKEQP